MCFSFVRDPLSVHSALERLLRSPFIDEALSSASPRLYPVTGGADGFFTRHGHTLARKLVPSPPHTFRLLFCKILFFRNAGPTIVFPRCALAHSYRFLQSGPRYIGTPLHRRLSLPPIPYSLHVTPDWKVCSAENSLKARDIRCRGSTPPSAKLTSEIVRCRGYLLKEVFASLDRFSETSCVVRRIFVELICGYKKRRMYFLDRSISRL